MPDQGYESAQGLITPERTLQSLIDQTTKQVYAAVQGPHAVIRAAAYDGDELIDGPDAQWALALSAQGPSHPDAERFLSTVRSSGKDIIGSEGVRLRLAGPLSTASKLVRALAPHVQAQQGLHLVFSRGDIHTEVGIPRWDSDKPMHWGVIMKGTSPGSDSKPESGDVRPIDSHEMNRFIARHECIMSMFQGRSHTPEAIKSSKDANQHQNTTFVQDLPNSEADPRRVDLSKLKLAIALLSPTRYDNMYHF